MTETPTYSPDIIDMLDEMKLRKREWREAHGLDAEPILPGTRQLVVTRASSITPRRVHWMWEGRMALGELSLLAGREGLGKSTLTAWIAAQVTKGTLPGELHGEPRSVIVAATEDSWEHTLVPRLMAADADLDRVLRVEVQTATGFATGLNLPTDIPALSDLAATENVGLLILDPLMSRLESLDTHKDAEVRQALEPLVRLAQNTGMSIIGLIHLNKSSTDPLNAVMGSKAFTAVARSVSTVVEDKEDESEQRRLFGTVKNNLGPTIPASEVYTITAATIHAGDELIPTGRLEWHGQVDTTIKASMADNGIESRTAVTEATQWLEDYLALHPGELRKTVMRDAAKAGHAEGTVRRAAARLGVVSMTQGFPRAAAWSLPVGSPQSAHADGESVHNEHTEHTVSDQGKHGASVGSVGSVCAVGSDRRPPEHTGERNGADGAEGGAR